MKPVAVMNLLAALLAQTVVGAPALPIPDGRLTFPLSLNILPTYPYLAFQHTHTKQTVVSRSNKRDGTTEIDADYCMVKKREMVVGGPKSSFPPATNDACQLEVVA